MVSDEDNNRILVWDGLPVTDGEAADFALGQPNLTTGTVNTGGISASTLSNPTSIHIEANQLFVADNNNNNRVLVWNSLPTISGEAANLVLGQQNFTSNLANAGGISASSLHDPYGISSDGTQLFVSDEENNRILIWNTIPTTSGKSADHIIGQPNFTSNALSGMTGDSITFSSPRSLQANDNLLFLSDDGNDRVVVWTAILEEIAN